MLNTTWDSIDDAVKKVNAKIADAPGPAGMSGSYRLKTPFPIVTVKKGGGHEFQATFCRNGRFQGCGTSASRPGRRRRTAKGNAYTERTG